MSSQPHSAAVIRFALVVGKGAVCDGGFAGGAVHEDSTRMAVGRYAVIGKFAVVYHQRTNTAVTDGRAVGVDRCNRMAAERAALSHQVDIAARIDTASRAGQGHALQLYGGVFGFVGLIFDVDQSTAGGGQRAAVTSFVVVGLGFVIRQGKGPAHIIQVVYRDMAGEGVAVQVQGGAVLGVVDGHILGLVAQQVDGGVSFCILGIRCFHGLDGLVDAEILITANTGGVTACVLPRRGQGVDGLGFGVFCALGLAGGLVVFQPDEVFGVLDALGVQSLCTGQFDRTALGKQHIARDGAAVEQGLFTHGQGAAGSAQIQVAGQLAGGVIPDDAAHVCAIGGRKGDFCLGSNVDRAAVVGGIIIDFAAGHVQGRKVAVCCAHVHNAAIDGRVVAELAAIDGIGGISIDCRKDTAVRGGSVVIEFAAIDSNTARPRLADHTTVDSLIVVKFTVVDDDGVVPAVCKNNAAAFVRGRIIVVFAAINGKGISIAQIYTPALVTVVLVDFDILQVNGRVVAILHNAIAGVFRKHCAVYFDIIVVIQPDTRAGAAGKGYIFGRNINVSVTVYGAGQVAQGQGLAGQYQRVMGRFCAAVHLNAVGRAGEDTAVAALFIVVGLFIGQGKGFGVLTIGQGDLAGEGIAVQVQGDGVIHGGSRDLFAHIGQQVDAGGAVFLCRLIQRGLQGGVLFAGQGAEQAVQTGHNVGRALQGVVMLGAAIVGDGLFNQSRVVHQPGIIHAFHAFQLFSSGQGHFARVLFHKHIADTLVAIGGSLFAHSEAGPRTNVRDAALFGRVVFDFAILGGQAGGQHSAVCIFHIQSTAINA